MGDILLFKGNRPMTMLTRTVTWCEFDHVAMILKFESDPDEVYILESAGDGVTMNNWTRLREVIGKDKFYKMVVYRHIEFDRS